MAMLEQTTTRDQIRKQGDKVATLLRQASKKSMTPTVQDIGRSMLAAQSVMNTPGANPFEAYTGSMDKARTSQIEDLQRQVSAETDIFNVLGKVKEMGDADDKAGVDAIEYYSGGDSQKAAKLFQAMHEDAEPIGAHNARLKAAQYAAQFGFIAPEETERRHKMSMDQRQEGRLDRQLGLQEREFGLRTQELDIKRQGAEFERMLDLLNAKKITADISKIEAETAKTAGEAKRGPEPKQWQSEAAGYADRMENGEGLVTAFESAGFDPVTLWQATRGQSNVTASPELQQYKQAAADWIRAKLRKESGATIPPDEMQQEYETYFPVFGDSPEVIKQKRQARAIASQAMRRTAGDIAPMSSAPQMSLPQDDPLGLR